MKTFVVLVLTMTALFLWQRKGAETAAHRPSAETQAVQAFSPRAVSEGDWAKHSIDRARQVAEQVQSSRPQNDQP